MSDLNPLSQNRPGVVPAWTRTAMQRAAESTPTSRYFTPLSLICSSVDSILGNVAPPHRTGRVPAQRVGPSRNFIRRKRAAYTSATRPPRAARPGTALTSASFLPIFVGPLSGARPAHACRPVPRTGSSQQAKEVFAIRRPMKAALPVQKDGPRINDEIRVREVQLIDQQGKNHGVVTVSDALAIASEAGLDLVEVVPNKTPPVCKILDYGKFKYQEQKKAAEARKKQKIVEIKEIKFRPMIDDHDYDVKMRSIRRFFEEGDKVKVTLRFRGRELAHQELGSQLLERVRGDLSPLAKVEQEPKFEGRQMVMVLSPR